MDAGSRAQCFFSNGNITEQAKGAVDLTQEQLTVRPTAVKKSAFQITSSVRSWWFAAKSDAERDEWIKAIRFVRISLASDLVYFFSCMWDCSDPFNHTNSAVQEAKKSALKFTPTVVTRGSYVSFWSSGCCSVTLTQSNACQLLDLERISEANWAIRRRQPGSSLRFQPCQLAPLLSETVSLLPLPV
jgi:hypothetical protein